jgi:hypothetical protein
MQEYFDNTKRVLFDAWTCDNLVLVSKLDNAMLVETRIKLLGNYDWMRCYIEYSVLCAALGRKEVESLLEVGTK